MIYQKQTKSFDTFFKVLQVAITLFTFVLLPALCFEIWLQKESDYENAHSYTSNATYVDGVYFDKHGRKQK